MRKPLDFLLREAAENCRRRKMFFQELLKHDIHFYGSRRESSLEACGYDLDGEFFVPVYLSRAEMPGSSEPALVPIQMSAFVFFKRYANGLNVVIHPSSPHSIRFSWDRVLHYLYKPGHVTRRQKTAVAV